MEPRPSLRERLGAAVPDRGQAGRLLALTRPHALALSLGLALLAGSTVIGLAVPWVLGGLAEGAIIGAGSVDTARSNLDRIALLLVGLLLLRGVLTAAQMWVMASVGERIVLALRRQLFDHLTRLGPTFFDDRRVGELVSRLMVDVAQTQSVMTSGLAELMASGMTLAGAAGVMAWRSPGLAAVILAVVPPVVLLARLYARAMHSRSLVLQDRMAEAAAVAEEGLGAIRLVQVFAREPHERNRFGAAVLGIYDAAMGRARASALFVPAIQFLTTGAVAVVLWAGGRRVVEGQIGLGELVAFLAYAALVGSSTSGLVGLYGRWSGAMGASRRVFHILDEQAAVRDRPDAVPLQHVAGRVTFDDVTFSYGRGGPVLQGLNLEVPDGTTLALVGATGAGKSTVMHLIARHYDPAAGRVAIDGHDLRDVTLASLRACIGVVPQETMLFNATIAENLRYGRLDASDEALRAAAAAAYADEFIERLPAKYETLVGERGIRLSAGQRQRLAIARALLKDPQVLLLDEATASLDSESEAKVQAALARLFEDRTVIVAAHRLSTVRGAHQIAVMEGGRIVELGTHTELLARAGLYTRLCETQLRGS